MAHDIDNTMGTFHSAAPASAAPVATSAPGTDPRNGYYHHGHEPTTPIGQPPSQRLPLQAHHRAHGEGHTEPEQPTIHTRETTSTNTAVEGQDRCTWGDPEPGRPAEKAAQTEPIAEQAKTNTLPLTPQSHDHRDATLVSQSATHDDSKNCDGVSLRSENLLITSNTTSATTTSTTTITSTPSPLTYTKPILQTLDLGSTIHNQNNNHSSDC